MGVFWFIFWASRALLDRLLHDTKPSVKLHQKVYVGYVPNPDILPLGSHKCLVFHPGQADEDAPRRLKWQATQLPRLVVHIVGSHVPALYLNHPVQAVLSSD